MKIFVYGTLRRGERNHGRLEGSTDLGLAKTEPHYALFDNHGQFPYMVNVGNQSVVGELYDIDANTRSALDYFEGHPRFYRRQRVLIEGRTKEPIEAYMVRPAILAITPGCRPIPSGDWCKR